MSKAVGKDETHVGDLLNMLKMDQRVIDDLLKTKSISDARILRMIRSAAPVDKNGHSQEQVTLYNITKEDKLNRTQLANLIKERKNTLKRLSKLPKKDSNKERININVKKRSVAVNISSISSSTTEICSTKFRSWRILPGQLKFSKIEIASGSSLTTGILYFSAKSIANFLKSK